jgi:hypothetical protein
MKGFKPNLDRPATYQIKIPGELDENWTGSYEKVAISVDRDDQDQPVSTLTGTFDQAALQGLLRSLYSLGLPLMSVLCVDWAEEQIDHRAG